MDPISEIQIYLSVVEHGSFTKAAKALDLSKSYVSKRVKALEDRLRARLLHRTTRAVQTTPAGQQFFEQARDAIQHLRDAEASVSAQTDTPSGRMRITVPQSFGTLHLTPVLLDFAAAYPEVELEVHYTDRKVDLVEAGFDLGIRIGKLMDSSMVAQRLTPMTAHLVASPAYLADCDRLIQPEDLSDTAALVYTLAPAPNRWTLTHRTTGETRRIKVKGRLEFDSGDALLTATLRGFGVSLLPDFFVHDALKRGDLVPVLPDWCWQTGSIWAIYPNRRHLSSNIRHLIAMLKASFHEPEWREH